MNFSLSENIDKRINIPKPEFISKLEPHISEKFHLFSENILFGKISDNILDAKINPPIGAADPFKSLVYGTIDGNENYTILKLNVGPSWIIWMFLFFLYAIGLMTILDFEYTDLVNLFAFIGIEFLMLFLPLLFTRLKVRWDRIRLERRIIKIIELYD